jgi:hypothetical protein
MRPQTEILEELVSQIRGLGARMREYDQEMLEREYRYRDPKYFELDARMVDEMLHTMMDTRDGEVSLLLLAGVFRDRMPWLAEVFVESYRELKNAKPEEAREIGHRLMRVVKQITRGPFGERLVRRSKAGHVLLMELPHFVDRAISLKVEAAQITESDGEAVPGT